MPARSTLLTALAVALLALPAPACGDDEAGGGAVGGTVTVLAAASLTDAMADMAGAFEAAEPGVTVRLSFGPSSGLREQILAGAPADVYASADAADVDRLVAAGEVEGATVFARNRMAIAVPEGNPGGVTGLDDLADPDLLLGLCAAEVPCGRLAREVLGNAGIEPAPDTNARDVRALLTQVTSGDLDAGIVYRTDVAAAAGDVEGIPIGAGVNAVAEYPIAPLVRAGNPAAAGALVDFVLSSEGEAILTDHGFDRP